MRTWPLKIAAKSTAKRIRAAARPVVTIDRLKASVCSIEAMFTPMGASGRGAGPRRG